MNAMCNGSAFALLQQTVAAEMQGRVFTLVKSLCSAASPLGMAIGGLAADAVGVRTLYVLAGLASVMIGVGGFFMPAIMHLEDNNSNGHTVVQGKTLVAAAVPVLAEAE
jgi:DHA3 family macrolide efflux protein-like MFS transporter